MLNAGGHAREFAGHDENEEEDDEEDDDEDSNESEEALRLID